MIGRWLGRCDKYYDKSNHIRSKFVYKEVEIILKKTYQILNEHGISQQNIIVPHFFINSRLKSFKI